MIKEKQEDLELYVEVMKVNIEEKETLIMKNTERIKNLERKLGGVKDFVFQNCSDKLD